jgi:hypothetical protein
LFQNPGLHNVEAYFDSRAEHARHVQSGTGTQVQSMRDMYKVAPEHKSRACETCTKWHRNTGLYRSPLVFPPSMITPLVFHIHSSADWGTGKDRSHQRTSNEGPEGE